MTSENVAKPKRTGKPPVSLDITGYVFAHVFSLKADTFMPLFLHIDEETYYVALFSTAKKLKQFMANIGAKYKGIKRIDDGRLFLAEFPHHWHGKPIMLICNPIQLDGRIRFTALFRD